MFKKASDYPSCLIHLLLVHLFLKETFPNEFTSGDGQSAHKTLGHFYGSSYATAPNGFRTPSLSRLQDGLLIVEIDLNLCRQMKDKWGFRVCSKKDAKKNQNEAKLSQFNHTFFNFSYKQMTNRLSDYVNELSEAIKDNYKPIIIRE